MARRHLVLVGGGHAHALVLADLARRPEPALDLTLISPGETSPYSGMLPGAIGGLYPPEAIEIPVRRLVEKAGGRFVDARAARFDAAGKRVLLEDGATVGYDILSIDIGITPDLSQIAGAEEHALAVKPIGSLLSKIEPLVERARAGGGLRRVAVVGTGAAGTCLAFALARRLRKAAGGPIGVTLLGAHTLLPEINPRARALVRARLVEAEIGLVEGARVTAVEPGALVLETGERHPADAVLVAVGARAPPVFARSDLATDPDGFLAIRPTLQVVGDDAVFAAGDCAGSITDPRPKAGVFAVRQGPVLARNLRAAARGEPLEAHQPQRDWLVLISTADGRAVAARGAWFAWEGRLAWWLKDRIDRRFVEGLG